MHLTGITPVLNVSDVLASLQWFEGLGWVRAFTFNDAGPIADAADTDANGPARFASVCAGEGQIFLCQDAQGLRGGRPPTVGGDDDEGAMWMSWWLQTPAEVDAAHALAVSRGYTVTWPPTDEPWGVRECRVVHPDGHTFRISAPVRPTAQCSRC